MRFCPRCGAATLRRREPNPFFCSSCDFQFFFNAASAVGAVIREGDKVAVGIRGREPSKGLLDFPGGFVDPGESLETALVRELEEELGQRPSRIEYLTSSPNTYLYAGITYTTCDAFFLCEFDDLEALSADDDMAELVWVDIAEVRPEQCAFDSTRVVFEQLKQHHQISSSPA